MCGSACRGTHRGIVGVCVWGRLWGHRGGWWVCVCWCGRRCVKECGDTDGDGRCVCVGISMWGSSCRVTVGLHFIVFIC